MEPIHEVRLWVGLTPTQVAGLRTDSGAEPPVQGRFGMRLDPMGALDRAVMFDEEGYHPKDLAAMEVVISSLGYTTLVENMVLEKKEDNWYRWHGRLNLSVEGLYWVDIDNAQAFQ
jgi:hypothetical protein